MAFAFARDGIEMSKRGLDFCRIYQNILGVCIV